MSILKLYFNLTDELVSQAPTETDAITFDLRVDLEEADEVVLYAKCDAGYKATDVTVKATGTSVARWKMKPSTGPVGTWIPGTEVPASTGLEYAEITTEKMKFQLRANALDTEPHGKDTSVTIELKGTKVTL